MPAYITGLNIVAKVTDGQVTEHIGNDLGVDVNPFSHEINGVKGYYGGTEDYAVLDGYTNYIYLNADGYLASSVVDYPTISHIRLSRVETLDAAISLIIDDRAFLNATGANPVPGAHAATHEKGGGDSIKVEQFGTDGAKGRVAMGDGSNGIVMNFPFGATTISVGSHSEYTTIKAGLAAAAAMSPSAMNPIVVLVSPGFYVEDNSTGPLELIDYVHVNGMGTQNAVVIMPYVDTNYLFRSSVNGYGSINGVVIYACDGVGGGGILADRGGYSAYLNINFTACGLAIRVTGLGTQCILGTFQLISCVYGVVADTYGVCICSNAIGFDLYGDAVTANGGLVDFSSFILQAHAGVPTSRGANLDSYGQIEFHNGKIMDFGIGCELSNGGDLRLELVRLQGNDGYDIKINSPLCVVRSNASEFISNLVSNIYGAPILGNWRDSSDNIMKISGSMDMVGEGGDWLGYPRMTGAEQTTMIVGWGETQQGRAWFNTTKNKFVYWNGHSLKYVVPSQVVTVGKEGADYTSISAALASITDASAMKPYTILVNAGIYMEAPFTLKQYVAVQALGKGACVIWALVSNQPLVTMVYSTELNGFTIIGPTASQAILVNNVIQTAVSFCQFQMTQTSVKVTGSSAELYLDSCRFLTTGPPITTAILCESGGVVKSRSSIITAVNALKANGGTIEAQTTRLMSCTNGLFADSGGTIEFQTVDADACTYAVRTGLVGSNVINGQGLICQDTVTYDIYQESSGSEIIINGAEMSESKFFISDWSDIFLSYFSEGEANLYRYTSDFKVGVAELGNKAMFGEGGCHNRGMYVFTTDDTASSSVDGGNLTDVSDNLRYIDGYSATFQGVGAGYSMLIGSSLTGTDVLKHWGLNILQTTAAVEGTKRSFIFEIWNGSAWVEFNVMALDIYNYYRYGNEVFLRGNSGEGVFYGLTRSRVRIKNTLTTLPAFNQIRLMSSGAYFGENGYFMFSGTSRFKRNFCNLANYFGDEGGIATANINVGSGGVPTGWSHMIPRALMNGNGDAVQYQFTLPRGIDTGMPLSVRMNYSVVNAGTGDATFIASILPIEIQGVLEADPSGGITPVARALANTETVVAKQAQTVTNATVPTAVNNKLQSITFSGFSVANYYEGDMVVVRLEMDVRSGSQIAIWDLDVLGTLCALGENQ
jgi:hypothetical protein